MENINHTDMLEFKKSTHYSQCNRSIHKRDVNNGILLARIEQTKKEWSNLNDNIVIVPHTLLSVLSPTAIYFQQNFLQLAFYVVLWSWLVEVSSGRKYKGKSHYFMMLTYGSGEEIVSKRGSV